MKIWYIGYYDVPENAEQKRTIFPAAVSKMTYIANILGYSNAVKIVSPSITTAKKSFHGTSRNVSTNVNLKLFYTVGRKNLLSRYLSSFFRIILLPLYLVFSVRKDDLVVVYHSLAYMKAIQLVKQVRQCKTILEIEEIYGDVTGSDKTVKKELDFFKKADAYVFPTILLDKKINSSGKPFCVIHGTYQVEPDRNCKFKDGHIHVVYAGTFDPRKGGAVAAAAAEFLDQHYHIHIIGFGSDADKQNLLDTITRVSDKTKCKVTYDGLKSGENYIRFLQSCDIGLSTQDPSAAFNETSFPSKVLSYMANGLRVVSVRIKALETSAVNDLLYYYDKDSPEEIAKAIMSIDLKDSYDSRNSIELLNQKFITDMTTLMGAINE